MTGSKPKLMEYHHFHEQCGPQLAGSGFPLELWGILFDKLRHEVFDAGEAFQLARIEQEEEEQPQGGEAEAASSSSPAALVTLSAMKAKEDVWIIDHAWTFRVREARAQLSQNAALLSRIGAMILGNEAATVDEVYPKLWHHASTYRIATESSLDEECCWYVMDEVGTAIAHVEEESGSNCRVIPLYYPQTGNAMSVLWLTSDVEEQEVLSMCDALERSKCPGILRLLHSLADDDEDEDVREELRNAFKLFDSVCGEVPKQQSETTSAVVDVHVKVLAPSQPRLVKVACDLPELVDCIRTHSAATYEFVPTLDEADVIWLAEYQEGLLAKYGSKALFISQIGVETQLCHKEHVQRLIRRTYGNPAWLPRTYDAVSEMHLFAGDYLSRQANGDNNLWIVKPHCMARSMDMVVSDCLPLLLRQSETGPKIICKYIDRPCLFRGRKFDLRIIVAVQELYPVPILYMFEKVWPRFALEPYSMNDFDVYEKHWTVMNYANPDKMINLRNDDFVVEFDAQYGSGQWQTALERIKGMIVEVFAAVSQQTSKAQQKEGHGGGEGTLATGATIYGLDVMLTEDLQPMFLEATFAPDCHRACVQYPTFFADVFSTLFEGTPRNFTALKGLNGANIIPSMVTLTAKSCMESATVD